MQKSKEEEEEGGELIRSSSDTVEIVKKRLKAGSKLNEPNKDSFTPLHRAVKLKCSIEVINQLIFE